MPKTLGEAAGLIKGADGSIWFSAEDNGAFGDASMRSISHISTTGAVTTYEVSSQEQYAEGLVLGSDGNMWFTTTDSIGRITPTGDISYFPVSSTDGFPDLQQGFLGSDGDLWFPLQEDQNGSGTLPKNVSLLRVDTAGDISKFPVFSNLPETDSETLGSAVLGHDGDLYFADSIYNGKTFTESGAIERIAPDGTAHKFALPAGAVAGAITLGPDDNIWASAVVDANAPTVPESVIKLTPGGTLTSYAVGPDSTDGFSGTNIVAGTSALWEAFDGNIIQISTAGKVVGRYKSGAAQAFVYPGTDGGVAFASGNYKNVPFAEPALEIQTVGTVSPAGALTTYYASSTSDILSFQWDGTGHLWLADSNDKTIAKATPLSETRIAGSSRYATSVAISQAAYPGTAPVVFVATGLNYPDALSAAPAAVKEGGPLLLTSPNSLPSDVAAEITRLKPSRIVIVGGTSAISAAVEQQLDTLASSESTPGTVDRIAGSNRYQTSDLVTDDAFGTSGATSAFVATGQNYPDALAASAAAGKLDAPVILVKGTASALDDATTQLLSTLGATSVDIAGGTTVVSSGVQSGLAALSGVTVTRFAGSTRYNTSELINKAVFSSAGTAYFATGTGFADALSGAALAGSAGDPLYVVKPTCVPSNVASDLDTYATSTVTLLGGTSALTPAVAELEHC
ncbi:cell wall-binding repeat-containing protein [Frondihabitans sp. PAMC 28766]|uniref:cell wall-binding repeat-containing protein n=1 Tax=Frondihabitans sp. PAMC 28766 TaxID=1795630 RepID=UPI0012FF64D6|nr:cell wall-binding repeat-containing protein [Frondihabitans sp. PAMC 28766]